MTARALTQAEIGLCRSIFGEAIDYSNVHVFSAKWRFFQPRRLTMAPDSDLWLHPRGDLFCDDFCQNNLNLQSLFIHEIVHLWQHQKGVFLPLARHPFCCYKYELVSGKSFAQQGIKQPVEIASRVFFLAQLRRDMPSIPRRLPI